MSKSFPTWAKRRPSFTALSATTLSFLFVLFVCFSCINAETKLKAQLKILNTELPQELGNGLTLTSADYNNDTVTLTYEAEDEVVSALSFVTAISGDIYIQAFKAAMAVATDQDSDIKKIFELIVEAGAKLKIVFVGNYSGRETSFTLSNNDIQDILEGNVNLNLDEDAFLEEDAHNDGSLSLTSLKEEISAYNDMCPLQVDEATLSTGLVLEGNSVVYLYTLDEDYISAADLQASYSQMKATIRANLPQALDFVQLCVACQKKLVYRYIGSDSGQVVNITFTLAELSAML